MSNLVKTLCVFALPNIINTRGCWENRDNYANLREVEGSYTTPSPSSVQAMRTKQQKKCNCKRWLKVTATAIFSFSIVISFNIARLNVFLNI